MIMRVVDNLGVKEEKGFLMGYDLVGKGYKVYSTKVNKFFISKKCSSREQAIVVKEKSTRKIDLYECALFEIDL